MGVELDYREDGRLTLTSAKVLFRKIRMDSEAVVIRRHAYADHPERLFTRDELLALVLSGRGEIFDNKVAVSATFGSFLFRVTDGEERDCEIALKLDDQGSWKVIVINAFRRI